MNEHAGPACALSVLIVGVFAVLLHDKPPPPPSPKSIEPVVAQSVPGPIVPPVEVIATAPAPAPRSSPLRAVAPPSPTPIVEVVSSGTPGRPGPAPRQAAPVAGPGPMVRTAARRSRTARPRSSATVVEEGESLADVAARVYGSADRVDALWKANRDQLSGPGAPVARGTLLRTP